MPKSKKRHLRGPPKNYTPRKPSESKKLAQSRLALMMAMASMPENSFPDNKEDQTVWQGEANSRAQRILAVILDLNIRLKTGPTTPKWV